MGKFLILLANHTTTHAANRIIGFDRQLILDLGCQLLSTVLLVAILFFLIRFAIRTLKR